MKNAILILTGIFLTGLASLNAQVQFSNVTVDGTFADGKRVYGFFNCDTDTLSGPTFSYQWASFDSGGSDSTDLGVSTYYLDIGPTLVGRTIKFFVTVTNSYATASLTAGSPLSVVITGNQGASASNASISILSDLNVGSTLLGTYDYSDPENDPEGASTYQWLWGDNAASVTNPIASSNSIAYVIPAMYAGKYFKFRVTPVAASGNTTAGTTITSAAAGPANSAPSISGVSLPATASSGSTITVSYTFNDPDGDDDDCIFRWYRNNVEFVNSSGSYTITSDDQGAVLKVQVTARSVTGVPATGNTVMSNECTVSVSALPLATAICISGHRRLNSTLTGSYTYVRNGTRSEGNSRVIWEVDGIVVKEDTTSWANRRLLLNNSDWLDKEIFFKVVPIAGETNPTIGDTASSAAMTIITNATTSFSISEPPVILGASPAVGSFTGNGVSFDGTDYIFDPGHTDIDVGENNEVHHTLEDGTCTQHAYKDFFVDSSSVYFDSRFRPYFCYEDVAVTIGLEGLGDVDYMPGSGQFALVPSRPGGIITMTDTEVTINPRAIGPTNNDVLLLYQYMVTIYDPVLHIPIGVVPYIITKPLVVEFIDQALAITGAPDEYCANGEQFTVIASNRIPAGGTGTWSGPIIASQDAESALINPAADGSGLKTISYTYTTQIGCSRQVTADILVNPVPVLDFSIADGCIEHATDTTQFINSSPSPALVESWQWDFGETFSTISRDFAPRYMYKTEGDRDVELIARTYKGCSDTLVKEVSLGVKPEGDFYWQDDCFDAGVPLKLFDATRPTSTIDSLFWVFTHTGGSDTIVNQLNPQFTKNLPEKINVDYYLLTRYPGCYDTVSKEIYIRPLYLLKDIVYEEDFEGAGLGWIKGYNPVNTFELGDPSWVTGAAPGTNSAWYTNSIPPGVSGFTVESPCFDFTDVKRPMISMSINRQTDEGRDGAVLQYREGNNPVWENIGGTDFGIEWYTNSNITGRPGGSVVGWSPENKDGTSMVISRQYLDNLIGKKDVKLRIAYGSDGSAIESRGFAFDDVWIGSRSRKVLVEHFTNYNNSDPNAIRADNVVNTLMTNVQGDAMNIQYHNNYYAGDRLYLDNTAVPSARMLFYGLVHNPVALFDGGWNPQKFAKKYQFSGLDANVRDLRNESMIDPVFSLKVDTLPAHQFNVSIEPLEDISSDNVTLFIAIVAKEITTLTGDNGQTNFKNVLRLMLPDASGTVLKKSWSSTEGTTVMGPYSRSVPYIYDSQNIEVIAFLQNTITKEVYQAASSGSFKANVTSIGGTAVVEPEFKLFPNPAGSHLTLLFDKEVRGSSRATIFSSTGVVVREIPLSPGSVSVTVEQLGLPDGIYLVKVLLDGRPAGYRKLIVAGR